VLSRIIKSDFSDVVAFHLKWIVLIEVTFTSFLETTKTMTIVAALHLAVKHGDEPNIRQMSNGIVHISIPSLDNQCRLLGTTFNFNIGNLEIKLNQVQSHWKIEGKLTVSLSTVFNNMLYYTSVHASFKSV
jgi:hypothetical protein